MAIHNTKSLLVIIPSLHLGGAEKHLSQILPSINQDGWNCAVFLTSGTGELAEKLSNEGVTVQRPPQFINKLYRKNKLLRVPALIFAFLQLSFYLIRQRPTIVQLVLPEAVILGGIACILSGHKNVIVARRSLNTYQIKYPLISKIENWVQKYATCVITNNKVAVDQLIAEGIKPDKIHLIYNGIDFSRFTNLSTLDLNLLRSNYNIPTSSCVLLVLANIIPYKGHVTLLEALALINTKLPADWQLLCVGKKYPYTQELEALADQLGITSHVCFLDQQIHVEHFFALSQLVISSSYEEGFSNSVIEAQAASIPVIATNVGGNPEAIRDNVTGLLIPPKNPVALSEAILELALNQPRRQAMGRAANEFATANFSMQKCVSEYLKIYDASLSTNIDKDSHNR